MWLACTIAEVRARRAALPGRVALVPTMGALHEGHASLMRRGRQIADHVIATIFVNPAQFGPHEDFSRYPRTLEADLELCRASGVAGVFAPQAIEIYPPGQLDCHVVIPALADVLEGAARPGHFAGVCRVVAKLLNIHQPHVACFGMKDYQQLCVIRAMVRDLAMNVEIDPAPTVRESDGLAMSSRNRFLTARERPRAAALFQALTTARGCVAQGERNPRVLEGEMRRVLAAQDIAVDYAAVRDRDSLAELTTLDRPAVALVAGRLGAVRLLDNMEC